MTTTKTATKAATALDPNQFPFLAGLQQFGMAAIHRDGRVGLIPADKATPEMLSVARINKDKIIAEIMALESAGPTALLLDPSQSRWADPRHNLEDGNNALSTLMHRLFAYLSASNAPAAAYWDGLPEPKPIVRPYCYIKAELVNGKFDYWPMLAAVDGQDYLWADVEQWDYQGWLRQ